MSRVVSTLPLDGHLPPDTPPAWLPLVALLVIQIERPFAVVSLEQLAAMESV